MHYLPILQIACGSTKFLLDYKRCTWGYPKVTKIALWKLVQYTFLPLLALRENCFEFSYKAALSKSDKLAEILITHFTMTKQHFTK